MIKTEGLSKLFNDFTAVDKISLDIGEGEVMALLGPNGAGKTTTVRMLTSTLRPSAGRALVAGYDVVRQAQQVRAHVGVLTEHHGLYQRMPAQAYLDFFGQMYGMDNSSRREHIHQLLDLFGLASFMAKPIGEFSKGMRQKLALARALLHHPPVLLLDEPTSAMDPESAHLVRDAIRSLRSEERTILICTHNLSEAEDLSDKIAIIKQGRIILQGSPQSLKARLLGPAEYELRLGCSLNGSLPALPASVNITSRGNDWVRYNTKAPFEINPIILKEFLEKQLPVVSLHEVPRNLEQVYLHAIKNTKEDEANDVI